MVLLDTNTCISLLHGDSAILAQRLRSCAPSEIRVCSVVKGELYYGARHSDRVEHHLEILAHFFDAVASVPFDDLCAEHYGSIRADLARHGAMIGPNDLQIAATARAYDLTLITANAREFARVVGLRCENWA